MERCSENIDWLDPQYFYYLADAKLPAFKHLENTGTYRISGCLKDGLLFLDGHF
jgi:hypothetical protein